MAVRVRRSITRSQRESHEDFTIRLPRRRQNRLYSSGPTLIQRPAPRSGPIVIRVLTASGPRGRPPSQKPPRFADPRRPGFSPDLDSQAPAPRRPPSRLGLALVAVAETLRHAHCGAAPRVAEPLRCRPSRLRATGDGRRCAKLQSSAPAPLDR